MVNHSVTHLRILSMSISSELRSQMIKCYITHRKKELNLLKVAPELIRKTQVKRINPWLIHHLLYLPQAVDCQRVKESLLAQGALQKVKRDESLALLNKLTCHLLDDIVQYCWMVSHFFPNDHHSFCLMVNY